MAFVSIKKYLDSQAEELCESLMRFAGLILQAIRLHSVEGDGVDREKFQADIRVLEETFAKPPSPSEVLVAAGAAAKALENYNQHTNRFLHAQSTELQAMVTLLTQTLATVSASSERTVYHLTDIEQHLEKASAIEDFRVLKVRLVECLETVRRECGAQREEVARTFAELKEGIKKSQGVPAELSEVRPRDPVTGLERRRDAEKALGELLAAGEQAFVGVFYVERAELISSRFGQALADQVLIFLGQHLAQGLGSEVRLYRWAGSAFVALLDRKQDIKQVRSDLANMFSMRLERHFDLGSRSVLLPVSCNWTVFPCSPHKSTHVLIQQIDTFLNAQSPGAKPEVS